VARGAPPGVDLAALARGAAAGRQAGAVGTHVDVELGDLLTRRGRADAEALRRRLCGGKGDKEKRSRSRSQGGGSRPHRATPKRTLPSAAIVQPVTGFR